MSHPKQSRQGAAPLDLIEEAVALLRLAPARTLVAYYVGTLPFVLGLLYFWADMSRGAFAWQHCSASALGVALLYVWMKCWHAVFADHLFRQLSGTAPVPWTGRRLGQLVVTQGLLQGTGLFVLPVAAVLMVPFGWCYAFYHNVSVAGDRPVGDARRHAWQLARVWPMQNHVVSALLWFFGSFVFLNVTITVLGLPWLLKILLGIESDFTMSLTATFNTTFLAVVSCGTYLCLNPLIKTVYVLRCFYGESRQTGADLKATLRSLAAAALVLLCCLAPAHANPEPSPANPELSAELDQSIDDTLNHPQYTWRLPRETEPAAAAEKNFLTRFLDWLEAQLKSWFRSLRRTMEKLVEWLSMILRRLFKPKQDDSSPDRNWETMIRRLTAVLIASVVAALALLIWRVWKRRRHRIVPAAAETILPAINIADETVLATQLPPDGWLEKARELIAAGELRLALRALYLASLAQLGEHELLVITKAKSNREYERELRRRAHGQDALVQAFGANVVAFEAAWYGLHDVTPEHLARFHHNLDILRGPHAR